jgi:hypothetical protein
MVDADRGDRPILLADSATDADLFQMAANFAPFRVQDCGMKEVYPSGGHLFLRQSLSRRRPVAGLGHAQPAVLLGVGLRRLAALDGSGAPGYAGTVAPRGPDMDNRARPAVAPLDARNLPSPTFLGPPEPLVPPAVHLTGSGHGTYDADAVVSGAGQEFHLHGVAGVGGVRGGLRLAGFVHEVGFVAHGHARGEVTLADAHGSIVVALTGPDEPGFGPLPDRWEYRVEWATGAYRVFRGSGEFDLSLAPAPVAVGAPGVRGTFVASFS